MDRSFVIKSLLLASCFAILVPIPNAKALDDEQIIRGNLAPPKTYSYTAFVKIGRAASCSGAIVGKRDVLTAAHCLYDGSGQLRSTKLKVVAGTADVNDKTYPHRVEIEVVRFYVLKTFPEEIKRIFDEVDTELKDLAVLKLKKSFDFNEHISELRLPEDGMQFGGYEVTVTGFGSNDNIEYDQEYRPVPKFDGKMRYTKAVVFNKNNCPTFFKKLVLKNVEQYVCAYMQFNLNQQPTYSCSGDSGGPLVYKNNILVGTVSLSSAVCDVPFTLFAETSSFKSFIQKAINDQPDETMSSQSLNESYCNIM